MEASTRFVSFRLGIDLIASGVLEAPPIPNGKLLSSSFILGLIFCVLHMCNAIPFHPEAHPNKFGMLLESVTILPAVVSVSTRTKAPDAPET